MARDLKSSRTRTRHRGFDVVDLLKTLAHIPDYLSAELSRALLHFSDNLSLSSGIYRHICVTLDGKGFK